MFMTAGNSLYLFYIGTVSVDMAAGRIAVVRSTTDLTTVNMVAGCAGNKLGKCAVLVIGVDTAGIAAGFICFTTFYRMVVVTGAAGNLSYKSALSICTDMAAFRVADNGSAAFFPAVNMITGHTRHAFPIAAAFIMSPGMGTGLALHGFNKTAVFVCHMMFTQAICDSGSIDRGHKRIGRYC